MRRVSVGILAASLLLATLCAGVCAAEDAKTVTIGLIGSWTGPLGPMGVVSRAAAHLAQKHINEKGFVIDGKTYKLDFYEWDDRTDPKVAVAGATKMMDEKDVKIIIGPMYSASTLACQPITQSRGVLHITYSSATNIIRPEVTHTLRPNSYAKMRAQFYILYYHDHMKIKSMGFIVENMATARSMHEEHAPVFEARGGKVVGAEFFETGSTDFTTLLMKLKSKKPDALFICANPESAGLIMKQRLEIGWPVQTVGEGNAVAGGPDFYTIAGDSIKGHVDGTVVNEMDPGPRVAELLGFDQEKRTRFYKEYPQFGNASPTLDPAQLWYDYVHLAVSGMMKANSVNDTAKIREALLNSQCPGVQRVFKFLPNGQGIHTLALAAFEPGGNSDLLAVAEPLDPEMNNWKVIELRPAPVVKTMN